MEKASETQWAGLGWEEKPNSAELGMGPTGLNFLHSAQCLCGPDLTSALGPRAAPALYQATLGCAC